MTKRRILGFHKTWFGWSWKCDIFCKLTGRAYNPLSVEFWTKERSILIRTPWCSCYEFGAGR